MNKLEGHIKRIAKAGENLFKAQGGLAKDFFGDETTEQKRRETHQEAARAAQTMHDAVALFEEAYGLNQKRRERLQTLLQEGLETENVLRLHEVLHKIASELNISPFALNGTAN